MFVSAICSLPFHSLMKILFLISLFAFNGHQNLEYELVSEESGEGLCPYDPTHLSTATYYGKTILRLHLNCAKNYCH